MKRNFTLFAFFLTFPFYSAFSQWQADPALDNLLSNSTNDQQNPRVASDGSKGAIVVWADYRNDAGNSIGDIYVQRINKNGVNQWASNGVVICNDASDQLNPTIVEDGMGGAIIAWQDFRNGNPDIYAQRIDSSGNVMWVANGVSVVSKPKEQSAMKMIADGSHGIIITWEDSTIVDYDIYAQRISSAGAAMWTAGGVPICILVEQQINPKLTTDGSGGAIICWQDFRNGSDYDIYAQHINSAGTVQWTVNGVGVCSQADTQSNPKIASDHNNGAIIAWQDKRDGLDYDVYAQRLNGAGISQWLADGILICGLLGSQSAIDITSDSINGAFIAWKDKRAAFTNIYAQSVNLTGVVGMAANGILISTASRQQINPNVVGDGSGGGIVVWQDSLPATGWDIYSQRVNSSGAIVWTTGGIAVGTATGSQTNPKNISDGAGGSIYVFQDKRGVDYDVYAYKLDQYGLASVENEVISSNVLNLYPNPTYDGNITIQFKEEINADDFTISLYDMLGKFVFETQISKSGTVGISSNVTNGIYQYIVRYQSKKYGQRFVTGKIIVQK